MDKKQKELLLWLEEQNKKTGYNDTYKTREELFSSVGISLPKTDTTVPIVTRKQSVENFLNKNNIEINTNPTSTTEGKLNTPKEPVAQDLSNLNWAQKLSLKGAEWVSNIGKDSKANTMKKEEPLVNKTENFLLKGQINRKAGVQDTLGIATDKQREYLNLNKEDKYKQDKAILNQYKPKMINLLDEISKKETDKSLKGIPYTQEEAEAHAKQLAEYERIVEMYTFETVKEQNYWANRLRQGYEMIANGLRGTPPVMPKPIGKDIIDTLKDMEFDESLSRSEKTARLKEKLAEEKKYQNELNKRKAINRSTVSDIQVQAIMQEAQKEGAVKRVFGDALATSVNMLPSIAVSYYNPWVGASMLGSGALGNARLEALKEGATDEEAMIYAVTIGLSETMLQRLFLGSLSKFIPKGGANPLINQATRNTVANLSILGKQMAKSSGLEALEEGLQVPVEKLARKFTFDETVTTADVLAVEEILYNALLGAIVGTGFSAIPSAMNIKDMQKAKQYIDENGTNIFFTAYTLPRTYNSRATAENMMANPETITLENLMKLEAEVTKDYSDYVKSKKFREEIIIDDNLGPIRTEENITQPEMQEEPLRPTETKVDPRKIKTNTELKKTSGRIVNFGGPVKADTFSQFLFDEGYRVKDLGYGQWELSKDGISYSKQEMKKWDAKFKQFIRENMLTLENNFNQEQSSQVEPTQINTGIENNRQVYFQRINNFIADKIDKNVNTMVKRAAQSKTQMSSEQIQTFKQERYNELSDRALVIIDAIQNKDYNTLNNLVKVENDVEKTTFQEVTGLPVTSNKDIQEGINLLRNLSKPKADKVVDKNIRQKIKEDKKNANVTSKAKVKPKDSNRVIDEKNVNEIFELEPQRQDTDQVTPQVSTQVSDQDKTPKQVEPESKPDTKKEIKSTDISTIKTGDKFVGNMYQGRGKSRKEIYNYLEKPILGEGSYFAFDEKTAKLYGDSVTKQEITLDNPLVIRDDADWDKITTKAGWEFRNIYGTNKEKAIKWIDDLEAVILKEGYDGVIIAFENDVRGDENYKTGNAIKSLRNVFSHDQVVVYPKADSKINTEPKTTDEILGVEKEEVKNELVETISEFDLSKTVRFKKQFINIKMNNGKTESIASETYNGLAVHKAFDGKRYSITHMKSGISFKNFDSKEQAKVFARVLADTFDANVSAEKFVKQVMDDKEAKKYFDDLEIWVKDNINDLGKKKNNIIELERLLQDVKDDKLTPDDLINRIEVVGNDVSGFNFSMREQIMEELINGIKKDTISINFKVEGDGYLEIKNAPDNIAKILTALKLKLKPKGPPAFKVTSKAKSAAKSSRTQAMAKQDSNNTISKKIDQKTKDKFFSEPVSRSEIENLVSELLDIPVSQGKFRQRALGIFKIKSEAIRLKRTKDLDVLFHEVGHFLDKKLNLSNPKFEAELLRLGATTSRASYTKDTVMAEGVAEFFRLFITNPTEVRRIAPKFTKHFNELISGNETMKDFVGTMQTAVKNYIDQDSTQRVLGNISIKPNRRKLNIKQMWEKFYTLMVDDVKPLERVVKSIIGNVFIPVTKNPYEQVSIYRGRSTGLAKTFLEYGVVDNLGNKISKGLKEILEPIADEINDFRVYIVSVRALELNKRGIETGLIKKDLIENIEKLESDKFKNVFKELIEYQDHVLKQLVASGILSTKDFNNIKDMNKYYIPFYRVMNEATGGKGTGFQAYSPTKNIKGSTRDIVDPIESIIKNTYLFIDLAERNKIGKSFAELTREFDGTGKFIEKIPPDLQGKTFSLQEIKTPLREVLEAEGMDIEELNLDNLATIFRPIKPKGDLKVITIYENGKPSYYQVHDAPLYRVFMQLGKKPTESWMKILTIPAQLKRKGALLTPEFITRNPVRDALEAMIYSNYGFKMGIDSLAHIFDVVGKRDLYYKWLSSGAAMSDIQAMDRIGLQLKSEDIIHKGFKRAYLNPLNALSSLTQITEETTRVGEFVLGLEKEMAKNNGVLTEEIVRKVALSSRRLVLDYNRAGEFGRRINQISAFFNATVQGTDKIARTINAGIKGNKTERARAYAVMLRAMLTLTIPTILIYMINRDDEEYKELPDWVRNDFWLIKRNNEGGFIRIPKPYGIADLFTTLPERMLIYIDQEDPKAFEGMTKRMMQTFFGVDIEQSPFVPLPDLITPLVEVGANYSFFFQRPIIPTQELQLDNYAQYDSATSELAKTLGKVFDYSPRKIDHLFVGYGAGLAKYSLDIIDKGYSLVGKSDKPIFPERMSDYPVIKGFTYESVKIYTETTKDFYNELNRLEKEYKTQKRFEKIELDDYSKANELKKYRWVSRYLTDKRKQISTMQENKKSTKEINLEILKMINVVREEMGRIPLNTDAGYDEMAWEYKGKFLSGEFKRNNIKEEPKILAMLGFDSSVLNGPRSDIYKQIIQVIQSDEYDVETKLELIKSLESVGNTLTENGIERILKRVIK